MEEHRKRVAAGVGGSQQGVELNATERGCEPVANGEPDTGVSAPGLTPDSTKNTDAVLSWRLAVASSLPSGLNATENGALPVASGEPGTSVSAPPAPTENTDTLFPSA